MCFEFGRASVDIPESRPFRSIHGFDREQSRLQAVLSTGTGSEYARGRNQIGELPPFPNKYINQNSGDDDDAREELLDLDRQTVEYQ